MKKQSQSLPQRSLIGLVLALVTAAVYLPSLRHGFLDYDDQQYVTENPHVIAGFTANGLHWAFGFHAANWHPLTWLSHMLDRQMYGLNAGGHHFTNLLLHVANTVLVFWVLVRMTRESETPRGDSARADIGDIAGDDVRRLTISKKTQLESPYVVSYNILACAFVAALFGWHPLHVESVAWVAERKDVLSAFFFLLTLLAYAKYISSYHGSLVQGSEFKVQSSKFRRWAFYVLSLLLFALGLMSKPMVVTLPFVLLLLDYWPLGRVSGVRCQGEGSPKSQVPSPKSPFSLSGFRPLILEKIPFFVLSGAACSLTFLAQGQVHAIVSRGELPIWQRVSHAIMAYAHYLGAMILPRGLAVFYPYETAISPVKMVLIVLLLAAITLLAVRFATRRPYLIVGWLWYLGTLITVIGLVQVGDQAWADRYTYLPLIGLFIAVVWGLAGIKLQTSPESFRGKLQGNSRLEASIPVRQTLAAALAGMVGVGLLIGTHVQLGHWRNTRTLFEHAEKVTRKNHMAIALLGSLLARDGKLEEAIDRYHTALRIKPGYPEAQFFLGKALDEQGKTDEAIEQFRRALWYKPLQIQTHVFLGVALAKQKRLDEAAAHYRAALKLEPKFSVAHNNLARLLHTQGRLDEAIEHYQAALKYDPTLAQAHNNLGTLWLQKGKLAEGAAQLREALRLNPGNAETELNLAMALNQQEKWNEAADLFGKAVLTISTDANAHYQFGIALQHLRKTREAMGQFAAALLIRPDFPDALSALSWILSTSQIPEFRNGAEAVRMAERACELTARKDPRKLRTLAAGYAEGGRFQEAVATAETARTLASASGGEELARECELMAATFKSAKPWRAGF